MHNNASPEISKKKGGRGHCNVFSKFPKNELPTMPCILRKPISIKLRREKKVKRRYNAFLKGVIKRKRRYTAKWKLRRYYAFYAQKGVITPFRIA